MGAESFATGIPQVPSKIRFLDFAPDIDPLTPGALLDLSNMYPSAKGIRTYPSLTRFSSNDLPDPCLGAFSGPIGDNLVVLAGTTDALFYLDGAVWTDSGLTPSAIVDRWRFDSYNNEIFAVNGVNAYKYDGSTFGAVAGSPPAASIVQATPYALFLVGTNSSDWIATLNPALWTPSVATETVTGTIRNGAGDLTAAHQLRGGIAFYKRNSLTFGQFSGPPFYWDFGNGISRQIGAPGQEAVANLGDIHYFPGPDDFYSFDGSALQRVPNNLKEWFFANLNQTLDYLICARWDQQRSLIFWHFPSINASPETALDSWICLNVRTGKWTADRSASPLDVPIFSSVQTGQLTWAALVALYPTWDDWSFLYGDLRSRAVDQTGIISAADHGLYFYNGIPGQAMFTTHDFGDRENLYQVTEIQPQYSIYPEDGATIQPLNQARRVGTPVAGTARAITSVGTFDVNNTARLQRWKHVSESECEVVGIVANCDFAGEV